MSASIRGIIDHMFKDTVDNAETRALHEELLNNCLEHYEDLIARGMSETEAIDAVVESLRGMKEVIDEYPKKSDVQAAKKEEFNAEKKVEVPEIHVGEAEKEVPPVEKPTEYAYDVSEIRSLKTDLKNCDLKIGVSGDSRIHVRCEDLEQIRCVKEGSALVVKAVDKAKKSIEEEGRKMVNQDFTVKGLLDFIGKAIGNVAVNLSVSHDVYIDLPRQAMEEMDLNAKSGDIEVRAKMPEKLTAHNMSGDVRVDAIDRDPAGCVLLSAMSGDVEFEGNADTITMSSLSGDVEARGVFHTVEMKSTSGEVELEGEANQVRMNSVSGDVTVDLRNATVRSIEARSTSGDVDIDLTNGTESGVHTSMSTVSGSVNCSIPDAGPAAGLRIQAASVSGDITVK
jgi:DUF4097 and DUF4098 domain-containing protein YvlB